MVGYIVKLYVYGQRFYCGAKGKGSMFEEYMHILTFYEKPVIVKYFTSLLLFVLIEPTLLLPYWYN